MDLLVGYAEREPAGADVEAPSMANAEGLAVAHAVRMGSAVALCGAAVDHTLDDTWPVTDGDRCPRCADAVQGYQV